MKGVFVKYLILIFIAVPTFANPTRSVMVSGDCQRKVGQDRVAVTMTAEFVDANPTSASTKATQQYNQLRDKIKKLNLKDAEISTTEYSLNEEFEWIKNTQKSKGHRARQSLQVETSDRARVGEVLKIAQELGIKRVGGLNTFVSDELRKSEKEACLEEAFKNAKSKAERLAKASGTKIGNVIEMNESGRAPAPDFPRYKTARAMESSDAVAGAAPSIDTRSETIQVSLQVIFQLL